MKSPRIDLEGLSLRGFHSGQRGDRLCAQGNAAPEQERCDPLVPEILRDRLQAEPRGTETSWMGSSDGPLRVSPALQGSGCINTAHATSACQRIRYAAALSVTSRVKKRQHEFVSLKWKSSSDLRVRRLTFACWMFFCPFLVNELFQLISDYNHEVKKIPAGKEMANWLEITRSSELFSNFTAIKQKQHGVIYSLNERSWEKTNWAMSCKYNYAQHGI